MSEGIKAVQQFYAQQLKAYYLARYQAYCQERELDDRYELGQKNLVAETAIAQTPQAVQAFYQQTLELGDGYYPSLYQCSVAGKATYAVRIKTDGDDGWLTIFDHQGQLIATGQTYIEVVCWQPANRAFRNTSIQPSNLLETDFPGFESAQSQTLWGQPLEALDSKQPESGT
jgi:hypothetical protein